MTRRSSWLSAAEAAAALGVTRATLYAYVSRGLLQSQARAGTSRSHLYAREDLDRLRRRSDARKDPARAAAGALDWGVPVLESGITAIDGHHLYYRGHDVVSLARERSVAEIASLLWTGGFGAVEVLDQGLEASAANGCSAAARRDGRPNPAPWPQDTSFIGRAQIALAAAASTDDTASDLRPANVVRIGSRLLAILTEAAIGDWRLARHGKYPVDVRIAQAWGCDDRAASIIRMTLILCADHELNVSSFTARCVASAGATPYAAVIAALSAIEGFRHGGASARVEAMLASVAAADSGRRPSVGAVRRELAARLRRGDELTSFGHPLYPAGDPRATAILERLAADYPRSADWAFIEAVLAAARGLERDLPNVDFALAAMARVLRLPVGAPMALFAVGRSIGWIAHVLEQYATGQLLRPRARYVGPPPVTLA